MRKIIKISVPEYRMLRVEFDDGTVGTVRIDDAFVGVAQPLLNQRVFATAKIIDEGYAIGFDNCEYDVCSGWLYEQLVASLPRASVL